jgi:hypothetical protein
MRLLSIIVFTVVLISNTFGQTTPTTQVKLISDLVALRIPTINNRLSALVTGRLTENDGGGGVFYYDGASAVSTNLGTVFKPAASAGRWVRQYSGALKANWFGQSSAAADINQAIATLPASGGIVDATFYTSSQSIDALVSVGDATKRVELLLGNAAFTVSVPIGFSLARNSKIIGVGPESGTIITADGQSGRILLSALSTFNGEEGITIRDLELRLTDISDVGIEASFMTRSLVENVYISSLGGSPSTGTGIACFSSDANTRNYRNHFTSVIVENITAGVVLSAAGSNGPNSWLFTKCSFLGCVDPVSVRGSTYNTTFVACNIETTGGGTGVFNSGVETTFVAPFIESFTVGITNIGSRLRVYAPSWGANSTNIVDNGTDTFAEASSGGGAGDKNTWDSSGGNWGIGLASPNTKLHVYQGTSNSNGQLQVGGGATVGLQLSFESIGSGRSTLSSINNAGGSNNQIHIGFGAVASGVPSSTAVYFDQNLVSHFSSDVLIEGLGAGISVKEGANGRMGTATLVGGTITVANTTVTANTRVFISRSTTGGTEGTLSTTQIASTSFTVNSSSGTDTSTVNWLLIEAIP